MKYIYVCNLESWINTNLQYPLSSVSPEPPGQKAVLALFTVECSNRVLRAIEWQSSPVCTDGYHNMRLIQLEQLIDPMT